MSGEPVRTEPAEALELSAALEKFGWQRDGGDPGLYESWVGSDLRHPLILVPLDTSKGDYRALLDRARKQLLGAVGEQAERFLESLHQTVSAALDITKFRKETSLDSGLIPWMQGQELFDAARSSLVAAAKASRNKRRYHGNSSSYIAGSFIESSLMGQTEVGSFVVTAYTPAKERFFTEKADADREGIMEELVSLTGRQILQTLEHALTTTRNVLGQYRQTPAIELFGDAVEDGVSYELVVALEQLTSHADESSVTIEYQPAVLLEPAQRVDVVFSASDTPILSRAANFLARDKPPEDVVLRGRVTLLARPRPGEVGIIRLDVTGGSEARKVRVRLDAETYETALEAHRQGFTLAVRGRLEREGQQYWLYDADDLEVVSEGTGEDGAERAQGQAELLSDDSGVHNRIDSGPQSTG